jgi:hypothetical protein
MRDPNGIDLQSVDPDLSIDDQNPTGQHGVQDWEDYADAVNKWGEETVDSFGRGGAEATRESPTSPAFVPYFHPSNNLNVPFIVGIVAVFVVLLIVFLPRG